MITSDSTSTQKILSVSELNRLARGVLESSFPLFWVSGEVSNFTHAASGHWYFSLKDAGAQVRCVMFKGRNSYVDFTPREGDKIEARASVTLYEARGDFQLTVEFVQKAGLGALFEAFERLKAKLSHEGLFDPRFKKPIPTHPKAIGIVTSPDAAALRDVLTTLKRRNPSIPVIIYPSPVQGKGAAKLIANAIYTANERQEVDTLIICRGGGSLEDLWQFNEEVVARAVDDCQIPTISGVGHETDFTICDFVSDLRAATPTAAAELACADLMQLTLTFARFQTQLHRQITYTINQQMQKLDYLARRLISPQKNIMQQSQHLQQLQRRLRLSAEHLVSKRAQHLAQLHSSLGQLSPQHVLARGYSLIQNNNGQVISSSHELSPHDDVVLVLSDGQATARIQTVKSQ
jgi:exodeoxyribonuclease VII large subunit